ncbi:hypothetical protein ABT368_32115, partial [Streptomyces althioticus]
MAVPELIRIVSRDSPMALAQVERVRAELTAAHPGVRTEVVDGGVFEDHAGVADEQFQQLELGAGQLQFA